MSDRLLAVANKSLLLPSPLWRYRPDGRRERHGGVVLASFDVPGVDGGFVAVADATPPERVFALAAAFFGPSRPYSIGFERRQAAVLEAKLAADGWVLDEEEPALVLPQLPAVYPPFPRELAVRVVTDEGGLADFRSISSTPPAVVPSLAAACDAEVGLLVGYVGGVPVATSRLSILDGTAEIMGVVTTPANRHRGYGTAMTWAAIALGGARGCTNATLTATEMGYPVYIKMGFLPVGVYRTYVPRG